MNAQFRITVCLLTGSIVALVLPAAVKAQSWPANSSGYAPDTTSVARPPLENRMPGIAAISPDLLHSELPPPASIDTSTWKLFNDPAKQRTVTRTAATAVLIVSVSGLFLFLMRMNRKVRRRTGLPDNVVAVLGQTPFGPNQKLQLVRLGSKILLVTTSSAGTHTLGEITDPEEVLEIEALCCDGRIDSIGQRLRSRARAAGGATTGRTLLEA